METPGTAPGSEPLITSAFMSIVPKDSLKIGDLVGDFKGQSVTMMPDATTPMAESRHARADAHQRQSATDTAGEIETTIPQAVQLCSNWL